mmetsp:Transcript_30620/g.37151  ORF Transcript_30620/g.37151 Transcript_30620/m.37151 type:complete len:197 (+) Transcript_30620:1-591(+)
MCGCIHCDCEGLIVSGTMRLTLLPTSTSFASTPLLLNKHQFRTELLFAETPAKPNYIQHPTASVFARPLPPALHLVTLQSISNDYYVAGVLLLRLAHMYEASAPGDLAAPVDLDLSTLFAGMDVVGVTEMSLTANQPLDAVRRLQWRTVESDAPSGHNYNSTLGDEKGEMERDVHSTKVTIRAMEIRTWMINWTVY